MAMNELRFRLRRGGSNFRELLLAILHLMISELHDESLYKKYAFSFLFILDVTWFQNKNNLSRFKDLLPFKDVTYRKFQYVRWIC